VKDEAAIFDNQGLIRLSQFFAQIIDFRSPFTASHSSGVAASAAAIAERMSFSEQECLVMQIAGYLHDLGKLAVPT
jgi:HD-GYP domain-containing protein (c-di-GMP phosphodiesterase class II)